MLDAEKMQKIIDEVNLGIEPSKSESKEATVFRQGIINDIETAKAIAKQKKMKGFVVDYTPEFPTL